MQTEALNQLKDLVSEEQFQKVKTSGYLEAETKSFLVEEDFELGSNSVIGLVGYTGSGKSTLLAYIIKKLIPSLGESVIDDSNENKARTDEEYCSSTNFPCLYTFLFVKPSGKTITLKLIDCPGLCDTRGYEMDLIHVINIVKCLSEVQVQSIVYVVKGKDSRTMGHLKNSLKTLSMLLPIPTSHNFAFSTDTTCEEEADFDFSLIPLDDPESQIFYINNPLHYEKLIATIRSKIEQAGSTRKLKLSVKQLERAKDNAEASAKDNLEFFFEEISMLKPINTSELAKSYKSQEKLFNIIRNMSTLVQKLEYERMEAITKSDELSYLSKELVEIGSKKDRAMKHSTSYVPKVWDTVCNCGRVCHVSCGVSYDGSLTGCCAIGSSGTCTRCGCHYTRHNHHLREKTTSQDLTEYNKVLSTMKTIEEKKKYIEKANQQLNDSIELMTNQIQDAIKKLNESVDEMKGLYGTAQLGNYFQGLLDSIALSLSDPYPKAGWNIDFIMFVSMWLRVDKEKCKSYYLSTLQERIKSHLVDNSLDRNVQKMLVPAAVESKPKQMSAVAFLVNFFCELSEG